MPKKTGKPKIFVLDTNILISSAGDAIFGFDDNEVVITTTTLEELDNNKTNKKGDVGYGARSAIKLINSVLERSGSSNSAVIGKGRLRIEPNGQDQNLLPAGMSLDKPDNRIISSTKFLDLEEIKKGYLGKSVILVTNDIALRVKARSAGVTVQGYRNSELETDEVYTGRDEITVRDEVLNRLFKEKEIKHTKKAFGKDFVENEYLLIHGESGATALAYYRKGMVRKIDEKSLEVKGIIPKNVGQRFAMHALLDPEIPLVILSGVAGSGKTLLSVAAGLDGAFNDKDYSRPSFNSLLYTRNNVSFEKNELGALPGDEESKMGPLVRPLTDNLESILKAQGYAPHEIRSYIEEYMYQGIVKIESMAFMRGRSISNTFIIIDECQNATPKQIRGICTRASFNSRVVLLGDPTQIDDTYLSTKNNGLVFASQKMKGSPLCAQISFLDIPGGPNECIRSEIARECAERLVVEKQ